MKMVCTTVAAVAATLLAASSGGALKPVALAGGDGDDLAGMTAEVCAPNSIRY